jgi:outer membrane receptor protein involved in Fe transport
MNTRKLSAVLLGASMLVPFATPAFARAADDGVSLEEVIVTAQKRDENLQSVPVSIQALGSDKLEQAQVSSFNDYAKLLPSVDFATTAPGFSQVYMRGVASGGDGNHSGSLPSVGVYLDEQPITTIQGALDIHIYDVARVEALAGPQGTLYGASSQAGTIKIVTNKPSTSGFSAAYDVEANTISKGDAGYTAEGYVNIPLADNAAIRLVGWAEHDGGYIDNVPGTLFYPTSGVTADNTAIAKKNYNDVDTIGARAALKIDLNENWTITPSLMGQKEKTNGLFAYDPQVGDLKVSHFNPETSNDRWYQAALTVEGKLGIFDLTYAGSYMKRRVDYQQDYSDYSYFYDTLSGYGVYFYDNAFNFINPSQYIQAKDRYTKESHEFRLRTPDDRPLRALFGLYYGRQEHSIEQRYLVTGLADILEVTGWPDTVWLTEQSRIDRDKAVFGELSWDITPKLTATGGLRYFQSENSLSGFFGYGPVFAANFGSTTGELSCFKPTTVGKGPCTNLQKSVEETGHTYRLNLSYKIDDDKMVYATVSTGFRPGGINRRGTLPPYKSDFLTNYEIGWKTMLFDNRMRFNGAVYLEEWKDFQFSLLGLNGLTEIKNAGQAEIYGAEAQVSWRVTPDWTVQAGGAYNHAEITENFCGYLKPNGKPETNCPSPEAPTGTELPVTPKFKGNLNSRYTFTLGDWDAYWQASVNYEGSAWTDLRILERGIIGKQDSYWTGDLGFGISKGDYSIDAYVQNVTDERGDLYRYAECAETVCGGRVYRVPVRPRLIGIKFGQKF